MDKQAGAFKLSVPAADIADLRERLGRTRLPDQAPGPAWEYGADVAWMRKLVEYWRDDFDWRAQEARLNAFTQSKVRLHEIDLHFLHVEGKGRDPFPLLLSHGWPGSVFEFLELIPMLTDPGRFGGDPADSFTVVAPSLPGYGLSFSPGQPRFGVEEIADCFASLMTDVLGYRRFGAQGGDWGSFITSRLAYSYGDRLIGIHLNMMPLRRDPKMVTDPTPEEQKYLEELTTWLKEGTGYQWIQGTRPQTLAFALTDSPAGLAAWIIEKFRAWSDCGGDLESVFTKDELLANISLYWFTGSDRVFVLAILRAPAQTVAGPRSRHHCRADRLFRISAGDTSSAEIPCGTHIHRYSAMDRHAARRSFCGNGATRSFGCGDSRAFPAASRGACERARSIVSS
jgi:pimeloyl-ACP methyl ester carboxylesterase